MTWEKIEIAEQEAKRFLERARVLRGKAAIAAEDNREWRRKHDLPLGPHASDCPKESGALRRASLDLTRSLAEMRKP